MKNKIEDLRNHLFETLEALKDPDQPMDIHGAIAVATVGRVIVDSAKVENDFLKITGNAAGSGFIPVAALEGAPRQAQLPRGAVTVSTKPRVCDECKSKTKLDPCEFCGTARARA